MKTPSASHRPGKEAAIGSSSPRGHPIGFDSGTELPQLARVLDRKYALNSAGRSIGGDGSQQGHAPASLPSTRAPIARGARFLRWYMPLFHWITLS